MTSTRQIDFARFRTDPLALQAACWPHVYFYREQREVLRSLVENRYTWVPAAQKMGKDFVAGFACVWFFLTRWPCRVVTTSAKDEHLDVLWGEINAFVNSARHPDGTPIPLLAKEGGPLIVKHHEVNRVVRGKKCPKSYVKGMVAGDDSMAAMGGHHVPTMSAVPHTMFLGDECSSVTDEYEEKARPWAQRLFFIGNTWECDNFWRKGVERGDVPHGDESRPGLYSKVIRIPAEASPNVRVNLAMERAGRRPDGRMVMPGVKPWFEYQDDLRHLDPIQQTVCLHARFYVGKELRLFPQEWLTLARRLAIKYRGRKRRAKAIGVDPAEGGDKTAICVVDELGVIDLVALQTPNTAVIKGMVINLGTKYGVPAWNWVFDRGGGGKQIADELKEAGYPVRTVAFGEAPTHHPRPETVQYDVRVEDLESRGAYVSRRAEMYGRLSDAMNPERRGEAGADPENDVSFSIPGEYTALFDQLQHFPKLYDGEGKLRLPPKHKKDAKSKSKEKSLTELIGHSPDEADALVLAYYGMVEDPLYSEASGY